MKNKTLFIISVICTILCIIGEVFAVIFGIESLNLIYIPTEDFEGLALIVLLPVYLIISGAILLITIISTIFNIICIRNNYHKVISICILILNLLMSLLNIIMFILMIIG